MKKQHSKNGNEICPKCDRGLILVLDKTKYHPTGASGAGMWIFRTFDLYKCLACGEFFYVKSEIITAEPLYGNHFYKRAK